VTLTCCVIGTKQACFFRDSYTPLTATGFDIYGLSNDSPKSNTTFKTKQNLPYPLLCDTSRTLLAAIGLQGAKSASRGVFVIDKEGKVLAAEPGSPDGTVEVVRRIVGKAEGVPASSGTADAPKETDAELAKTASEVADTAAKIDGEKA
jgi:peroxiredoxin Q/BCP